MVPAPDGKPRLLPGPRGNSLSPSQPGKSVSSRNCEILLGIRQRRCLIKTDYLSAPLFPWRHSTLQTTTLMAKIIIIDDEASILKLMGQVATRMGHQVSMHLTGKEGMAAMEKEKPELLIVDLRIP